MERIPLFPLNDPMSAEQDRVYQKVIAGPRGVIVGPLRALLHTPELADRFQHLGALLRFEISLPDHLKELAILVTARRWNSQVEWHVHSQTALKHGLTESVIDAIREGREPEFSDDDELLVYEFSRQLQMMGAISQKTYKKVNDRFGTVGVVELTALIGYYTMVSMTLNAHEIPLPEGSETALVPVSPADKGIPIENTDCSLTMLVPGIAKN